MNTYGNRDSTFISIIFYMLLLLLLAASWFINGMRFMDCNFEPNYRCEAIHGIGIIMPPASYITVWFADDDD